MGLVLLEDAEFGLLISMSPTEPSGISKHQLAGPPHHPNIVLAPEKRQPDPPLLIATR